MFSDATWELMLLENSVLDYAIAIGIFLAFVAVFRVLQWIILGGLDRVVGQTETEFDDALVTVVRTVRPPFYTFLGFYLALQYLEISGLPEKVVNVLLLIWLVYQVVVALQIFIDVFVQQRLKNTEDKAAQSATHIIHSLSSVVLWILAVLFVLSNLGVNVTSLIAGLGIGGIAFALAAQNVLSDLFSSLAIYFDKPFLPGDLIEVGSRKGRVQKIGIKTTRLKSLSGEEIVISNQELTSAQVSNFGRMKERRVVFKFGVTYETPSEKLRVIPETLKKIIEPREKVRFGRTHFRSFDDSALTFEVVYFLKTKDYEEYVTIHQDILFAVKEAFEADGIDMAYPTQTLYVQQS